MNSRVLLTLAVPATAFLGALELSGCTTVCPEWAERPTGERIEQRARLEVKYSDGAYQVELHQARSKTSLKNCEGDQLSCIEEASRISIRLDQASSRVLADDSSEVFDDPRWIRTFAFEGVRQIAHITATGLLSIPVGSVDSFDDGKVRMPPHQPQLLNGEVQEFEATLSACANQPGFDGDERSEARKVAGAKSCAPCLLVRKGPNRGPHLLFAQSANDDAVNLIASGDHECRPLVKPAPQARRAQPRWTEGPNGDDDDDGDTSHEPTLAPIEELDHSCQQSWRYKGLSDTWLVLGCGATEDSQQNGTSEAVYAIDLRSAAPGALNAAEQPSDIRVLRFGDPKTSNVSRVTLVRFPNSTGDYALVQTGIDDEHKSFWIYYLPSELNDASTPEAELLFENAIDGEVLESMLSGLKPYDDTGRLIYVDNNGIVQAMDLVKAHDKGVQNPRLDYQCQLTTASNQVRQAGWTASRWVRVDEEVAAEKHDIRFIDPYMNESDRLKTDGEVQVVAPIAPYDPDRKTTSQWIIYKTKNGTKKAKWTGH